MLTRPMTTSDLLRGVLGGAAAGAAGTTALNAVSYLDMVARGRPASTTPDDTVDALSKKTGVPVPGDEKARASRVTGLGSLTGLATGIGVGALVSACGRARRRPNMLVTALVATAGALIGSNVPM